MVNAQPAVPIEPFDYNCIFCAIAAKRAPAAIVYESETAMAFMDIYPVARGHVLVIPKNHRRNIFDLPDADGLGLVHATRIIARAVRIALNADGINILQSNERAAGQEVFHFHWHIIPRFEGDGVMTRQGLDRIFHWESLGKPGLDELRAVADKIHAQIRED